MAGGWCAALTALVLAGALGAPAQATVRTGTGSDPTGDTANQANDVTAGTVQVDDAAGRVVVTITTAAAPASYSVAIVGTMANGRCGAPMVQFGGGGSAAAFARDTWTAAKQATMRTDGTSVSMTAADAD